MGGRTEKKKWRNSREEKLTLSVRLALQAHRVGVPKPPCLVVRLGPLQSRLRERSRKARSHVMWLDVTFPLVIMLSLNFGRDQVKGSAQLSAPSQSGSLGWGAGSCEQWGWTAQPGVTPSSLRIHKGSCCVPVPIRPR